MSDVYIVVHIATTCDESTTYVTKDSSELIEFAWSVVDATTLENLDKESVLVRPVNTPITPYCSQLHRITWEHVRNAGSFKDAIVKFDTYIQDNIISKNKEFSLVTFDMSKLRVQLPREARDKAVVLPPYLQHPRVFDLSTEYAKWQITHPEALSYTASSLSNVITALEVEIDSDTEDALKNPLSSSSTPPPTASSSSSTTSFSSEPSTTNPARTSPPAAPVSSDTKTMATVNLFTKILVQLIRKSIPIEDHASVLTKPYDSAKDVSVFLSERSKILYLYNLPNDTTQSELESWFTQFGGRPIAFWTLKNLDTAEAGKTNAASNSPHKSKGIAGFAVFATHEEASESLSMNGRVLNDRAIEVQPSSTRVLDKASDLLTPFPPSKNRARPGDWTCPSCGFSNFQRRTHCFRCSFPASSAVAIQESIYSNNNHNGNNRRTGNNNGYINGANGNQNNNNNNGYLSGVNGNQNNNNSNSTNGQPNFKLALNSAVVNAAAAVLNSNNYGNPSYNDNGSQQRGSDSPYSVQQSQSGVNHHNNNSNHNQGHHNNNNNNHSRLHYNNSVPFRAGDWKCEVCIYHNFAKNLCCLKCGASKPALAINNHQVNTAHSVNSTAAAIAAATASGQPLNLSNGFMGLQQPQPQHANSYGQQRQARNNSVGGTNGYNNTVGANKNHYQYNGSNLRGSGNGTPTQLLPQQLMMMQQQVQQQQQQQYQQHQQHQQQHQQVQSQIVNQQKYSNSVNNSPGLYPSYGAQQASYSNKNISIPPHSAPGLNEGNNQASSGINPSFDVLAGQINSLTLNQ
ncbi:hypothetical protein G9P44_001068 [Scheffersomyces stipitis]|nr:hypothetical protein G9P44_001068 [Scheffersomyces stipitis]